MPYIRSMRSELYPNSMIPAGEAGELNYQITMLCQKYIETNGESYQEYNDIIGALECAKLELYRRKIALYEDKKIKDNSDVY